MSDDYFDNMLQIIQLENLNELSDLANNETNDES
jgi:hypothetical protein